MPKKKPLQIILTLDEKETNQRIERVEVIVKELIWRADVIVSSLIEQVQKERRHVRRFVQNLS